MANSDMASANDLSSKMKDLLSGNPNATAPSLPPTRLDSKTVDEQWLDLRKTPLFMTDFDPNEDNPELEALRALAYEGTPLEVATNFKEQGNDAAKSKRWSDAKEFYSKAVAVLRRVSMTGNVDDQGEFEVRKRPKVEEVLDEEEERARERGLEELCLVNRALANLELSMCL